MAAGDITYQIVSFTHGSTTLTEMVGCSVTSIVQFLPVTFNTEVFAQVAPIQGRQIEVESVNYNLSQELTQGAKGTIDIQLKEADAGTATISITLMLVGTEGRDAMTAPYTKRTSYSNEGTPVMTVSL